MSENTSGIRPVEFKILVEPHEVKEKTEGGIYMVSAVTEREKMAQVKATLVAVGSNAFYDWFDPKPQIGDMVLFAKHAGYVTPGADGKEYRLINDKDITAIVS